MYTYKLTEEISRWAFEVHVKKSSRWWIAFTNPTAGPWKRLESLDENGVKGEVYRFDRDEKRPDIVIVNDELKSIVIFEAKDSIEKLASGTQAEKSCQVIDDMARTLTEIRDNRFWGNRFSYKIYNGLLWGSTSHTESTATEFVFQIYSSNLQRIRSVVDKTVQIGIESSKDKSENICLNFHSNSMSDEAMRIIESLKTH